MESGYLILETGNVFEGQWIGSAKESVGEVVFNTSMTGYQEIVTDPSYAGQMVTFCYPMIGNYGVNTLDNESIHPHLAAIITGEVCTEPSHYTAVQTFSEQMEKAGVPGLTGVDTRALVKTIREKGTVRGWLSKELPASIKDVGDEAFWTARKWQPPTSSVWVEQASTKDSKLYDDNGPHVVLMDFGHKKSILAALLAAGCKVTVVPYNTTYTQINQLRPAGVVFSNGPGDPLALTHYFDTYRKITSAYPSLGICLGHQLIALAHGAQTTKLKYGHRGGNHPVKDAQTGKVYITPQNHSYVVTESSVHQTEMVVSFHNVNDRSVEGLRHTKLPIQTVQFHPEAHPGPSDTAFIFDDFLKQLTETGDMTYALT